MLNKEGIKVVKLRKTHLFPITLLVLAYRTNFQTLFISNLFNSYCIARDYCSSMRASFKSFDSI